MGSFFSRRKQLVAPNIESRERAAQIVSEPLNAASPQAVKVIDPPNRPTRNRIATDTYRSSLTWVDEGKVLTILRRVMADPGLRVLLNDGALADIKPNAVGSQIPWDLNPHLVARCLLLVDPKNKVLPIVTPDDLVNQSGRPIRWQGTLTKIERKGPDLILRVRTEHGMIGTFLQEPAGTEVVTKELLGALIRGIGELRSVRFGHVSAAALMQVIERDVDS